MTNSATSKKPSRHRSGLVTMSEFRTHFAAVVGRVEQGEEVVIARGRQPVAKLVPLQKRCPRRLGVLREMMSERMIGMLARAIEQPLSPLDQASLEGKNTDTLGIGHR